MLEKLKSNVYCSNPRYSWVTYFILSNICNFSQLILSILSTHLLFALSNFVTLSNFCHLLAPCYQFTFYDIISPYKCPYCTHHKNNSFSCLIVRTLSAPIYLSNSPSVFGHRAILTMRGDRTVAGGFLIEQTDMLLLRALWLTFWALISSSCQRT